MNIQNLQSLKALEVLYLSIFYIDIKTAHTKLHQLNTI